MISKEDCIALSGLTEAEVDAIDEHEHLGEIAAATLGQYLLHQAHGAEKIRAMIVDDIRMALRGGDRAHAATLLAALRQFLADYPEARGAA